MPEPELFVLQGGKKIETEGVLQGSRVTQPEGWITPYTRRPEMEQFNSLMEFVRDTRDQQQKYLETVKQEDTALIERYRAESVRLIDKIEARFEKGIDRLHGDLTTFRTETVGELKSVRGWYAATIIAIILAALAIIFSR